MRSVDTVAAFAPADKPACSARSPGRSLLAEFIAIATSVALLAISSAAHAMLLDENGGQLYHDVTGLVWLKDARLLRWSRSTE